MAYAVERIAEGHPLRTSLEALFARRALPVQAVVSLRGALARATLTPAPGAPAVALGGPLYLVHATAVPAGDRLQILGTVSWSDQGLPRMAAGLIDDAVSAGIQILVPVAEATELGKIPAAVAEAPIHRERPTRPERPRARPRVEPDNPHLDLSAEMALLEPRFDAIPAPERPGPAAAIWAADDDDGADDSVDAPPPPQKPRAAAPAPAPQKPAGAGWAAAVAASREPTAPRPAASARAADPADLGFDVDADPELRIDDVLIHPRFGRCRVVRPGDDKVKVRRPTGAFIDLHLKVCTFNRLPDEDGRRVFELRIGRK